MGRRRGWVTRNPLWFGHLEGIILSVLHQDDAVEPNLPVLKIPADHSARAVAPFKLLPMSLSVALDQKWVSTFLVKGLILLLSFLLSHPTRILPKRNTVSTPNGGGYSIEIWPPPVSPDISSIEVMW